MFSNQLMYGVPVTDAVVEQTGHTGDTGTGDTGAE
jgi:hypothetical protein